MTLVPSSTSRAAHRRRASSRPEPMPSIQPTTITAPGVGVAFEKSHPGCRSTRSEFSCLWASSSYWGLALRASTTRASRSHQRRRGQREVHWHRTRAGNSGQAGGRSQGPTGLARLRSRAKPGTISHPDADSIAGHGAHHGVSVDIIPAHQPGSAPTVPPVMPAIAPGDPPTDGPGRLPPRGPVSPAGTPPSPGDQEDR